MSFCATLQRQLQEQFPRWTWHVAENPNPSTAVIILSKGQRVPGEVIVSVSDASGAKLAESVIRGQAYCDFVNGGKADGEFALQTGGRILTAAGLS